MDDLKTIADRLLDPSRSELLRAVDLFEFQVGIFWDDEDVLDQARRFAAMKLMEHLEQTNDIKPGNLSEVADLKGYRRLYREVMDGSWIEVRRLPTDKDFDRLLIKRIKQAQFAADVVDFLCRSTIVPIERKPSLAIGQYVVRNETCVVGTDKKREKTKAKADWGQHAKQAVLIHLLLRQRYELMPRRIATKGFAKRLIKMTQNLEHLREFFSAYNAVLAQLPALAIKLGAPLKVDGNGLPTCQLPYDPIAAETIQLIEKYNSAID
jgi:hypothetical protein